MLKKLLSDNLFKRYAILIIVGIFAGCVICRFVSKEVLEQNTGILEWAEIIKKQQHKKVQHFDYACRKKICSVYHNCGSGFDKCWKMHYKFISAHFWCRCWKFCVFVFKTLRSQSNTGSFVFFCHITYYIYLHLQYYTITYAG